MKVRELTRDQLVELKGNFLCEIADRRIGESPSYYELANADSIVTDEDVFAFYDGIDFVPEDFSCTAGN